MGLVTITIVFDSSCHSHHPILQVIPLPKSYYLPLQPIFLASLYLSSSSPYPPLPRILLPIPIAHQTNLESSEYAAEQNVPGDRFGDCLKAYACQVRTSIAEFGYPLDG